MSQTAESFRTSVLNQLLSDGAPRAHAQEAVDLGIHAAKEALATMYRVLMSTPDKGVTVSAAGIAIGITRYRIDELEAEMMATAKALGLKIMTGEAEAPRG
ncbi:MAG: hypothetical protein DI555_06415 [Novosphingobium pentaromativorans]|uniref:Uncharacterized protein n=1 Tax=Novosphingobium pentaromativorans TaxID=205844 RepID=A0A2W5QNK9_9SPHN|nr:MAG: hypothetical protein DI555_06415 [Novosphingobium pentaromativorans]